MDRDLNPYRPGAGLPPPALVGRDQLIDDFGTALRRAMGGRPGKSLMPIGPRGVGKTVLLNRFREIAEREGLQIGFIEAPESGDFRRLLASRLRSILLRLDRGPVERLVRTALGVLKSFTLQLPDGSTVALDVDAIAGEGDSGDMASDITDVLVAVGTAARARGTGVLLAVDEVQYLHADELGALITAIHRTGQLNLPVVLVGAGLPQLPGLAGDAKSYAERLFECPAIGALAPDDASAVLGVPAAEADVTYTGAALRRIVEAAQGYPYFLQEWGYHLWNTAERSPIDDADVVRVAPEVQSYLDRNFFLVRFDRLTPTGVRQFVGRFGVIERCFPC